MFDTHAHVHDRAFDADRDDMLGRARAAGVTRIMTIGTDLADSRRAQQVALSQGLDYAIGIHPHEAKDAPPDIGAAFDDLLSASGTPPRAIGEMGLDFYYNHSPREAQERVLAEQLRYARERGFPAVFHLRDAFDEFIALLQSEALAPPRAVIHCFTGNAEQARRLTGDYGFRLGIGGVLTFKSAQALRDAVIAVGLEHLVLETDCPYLAPVPHRGQRNEPAYMNATAALLAELFGVSHEVVEVTTSATASALFGP
jgi:TatD DNase family protein